MAQEKNLRKLLIHQDVINNDKEKKQLTKNAIKKRNHYYEQLLVYGPKLPQMKNVSGAGKGWYRLPLGGGSGGKDKYLWFTSGETKHGKNKAKLTDNEILIRDIRDHDDTKYELRAGDKAKWKELNLYKLDKNQNEYSGLTHQQEKIVRSKAKITVIEGFPGTGKTIALLKKSDKYLNKKQIYLTYNHYLESKAKEWFDAKKEFVKNRNVYTFNSFISEFEKVNKLSFNFKEKISYNHLEAEANFNNFVFRQREDLKGWRNKIDHKNNSLLYYELYSHAFGLLNKNTDSVKDAILENYQKRKEFQKKDFFPAQNIIKKIFKENEESFLFPNLIASRELVSKFLDKSIEIPQTLKEVDVFLVDEIQDLTEIEYYLLFLYIKSLGDNKKIIIAGDESQTVRPSKFKWNSFNTVLRSKAKIVPPKNEQQKNFRQIFNLEKSLRAPTQIAKIIHATQGLYRGIDKKTRPSVKKYDSDVKERYGRVVYYSAQNTEELNEILKSIEKLPSSTSIYPGGKAPAKYENLSTPEEIKGLDYGVVGIVESGRFLSEIFRDIDSAKSNDKKLENVRTKIDRLRVAVSRATDMLILLDINPTSKDIRKLNINKDSGYRYFVEKLFSYSDDLEKREVFSIISDKNQLLEELDQNISREEYILKKIEQIKKSVLDNPKTVQNDCLSLLQNVKQGFHENEVEKDLYKNVLMLNIVTFFNSLLFSSSLNDKEFFEYRKIINENLNELVKQQLFEKELVKEIKIFIAKVEKFKINLISNELDASVVKNLNYILRLNKNILSHLKISKDSNLDALDQSLSREIDTWFEVLKHVNTPDIKTITTLNTTNKLYIDMYIKNADESSRKEKQEDFTDTLKIIYRSWAEHSERFAKGTNKDKELSKALECYKILMGFSRKNNEDIVDDVIRIMRRLNKYKEALKYLESVKKDLSNPNIYQHFKKEITDVEKIISNINEFNKEGTFFEEEIEKINSILRKGN